MYLSTKRIVNLHLPVNCQLKIFDQTIVLISLYGSEIAGFLNIRLFDKVPIDFLKGILKMKSSTSHNIVCSEFVRFPLEIQVKLRMIK